MPDEHKSQRPPQAVIEAYSTQNLTIEDVTHEGDGLTVSLIDVVDGKVDGIEKRGRGGAVRVEGGKDIVIRNIREMGDVDPSLRAALEKDIQTGDKEGFFSKLTRFKHLMSPERLDALMNLGKELFKHL